MLLFVKCNDIGKEEIYLEEAGKAKQLLRFYFWPLGEQILQKTLYDEKLIKTMFDYF